VTKIMGIINVTPDSFYEKSRSFSVKNSLEIARKMILDGADIIDIGGESTRPGSLPIDVDEELNRVIPLIELLRNESDIPISIDSKKPQVVKEAIKAGANFINDITGFSDVEMCQLAKQANIPICIMHMKDDPLTMQINPHYPNGIIPTLMAWFKNKIEYLQTLQIDVNKVYLDPGIGFGKTVEDNFAIIQNLRQLKELGFPLLLGISRKSFMRKVLNCNTNDLLSATIAINTIAILSGVDIIRVHDVLEHKRVIDLLKSGKLTN